MKTNQPIILFDGVCNFCNSTVNFIIRQDKKNMFLFAPLQSAAGEQLLKQYQLFENPFDSFVLIQNGKAYKKSTAALKVFGQLNWYLKWLQVFWLVPVFVRNLVYDVIAKNRYKWFGKKEKCMVPTPSVRSRFLN